MILLNNVKQADSKMNEIIASISGYWENDMWDADDPIFNEFKKNINEKTYRFIDFTLFPNKIKNEVKYFILNRLKIKEARTYDTIIENYCKAFKQVSSFLNTYYQNIISIAEIDYNKAILQLRSYLIGNNISVRRIGTGKYSRYENLLHQLCEFYNYFYDTRDEFEKDVWDIRKIPGARVVEHTAEYRLNFKDIPHPFVNLVKRYIKYRVSKLSHGQCTMDIRAIKLFLKFIYEKYPLWSDLKELSRKDIEEYLTWYLKFTEGYKFSQRCYHITLNTFIRTIQQFDYEEAPTKPVAMLMFNEDIPRYVKPTENDIKYIPEYVLQQLEEKLEWLTPSYYIPIVILLRATGWRISDILNLRYNTCLEKTEQGWYLRGDILKTQVLNHRVPITDEVADIVKAAIETVKAKSTTKNNPKRFLFVRLSGQRIGHPPEGDKISKSLNRFAVKRNIVDENGVIFHFRNHAFRHTKGIELINNGMNLLHVQKWMAHASPEMTLWYAKILDTTMRKSWEEATKQGLFRINESGKPVRIDTSDIENEDIIEWEYIRHNLDAVRMPLGYCMKPKKQECHTQLNPCLTCRNLCTTPDFISQYEFEIQETKAIVERGKAENRSVWVEKNQALLERYETVLAVLKNGKVHHKAGKKGREYVGEERYNG